MLESVLTFGIAAGSFFLFCYWFRYTCQLILSAATAQDYAVGVAQAHQLHFRVAQARLSEDALGLDGLKNLGGLKNMLDHDYAVLSRLMNQAQDASFGFERQMLGALYRLSSVRYSLANRFSPSAARAALEEMTQVVAYLANSLGECAATSAAA